MIKTLLGLITKYGSLALVLYLLSAITMHVDQFADILNFTALRDCFMAGIVFTLLYFAFLREKLKFWETFSHELTHMVFAMLFLNRVEGIVATRMQGGQMAYTGSSNWLIRLVPYFFPLIPGVLMLLSFIVTDSIQEVLNYIVCIAYCWFLLLAARQFSFEQPDIQKSGRLFSMFFVPLANALIFCFMLFYLNGSTEQFIYYLNKYAFAQGSMWTEIWYDVRPVVHFWEGLL